MYDAVASHIELLINDSNNIIEAEGKKYLVDESNLKDGDSYVFKEPNSDAWCFAKCWQNFVAEGGKHPLELLNSDMIRKRVVMSLERWDAIMLTMLSGGDLNAAEVLSVQSEEYKKELLKLVNKLNILNLQEFVFGYMCGSGIINKEQNGTEQDLFNFIRNDIKTKSIEYADNCHPNTPHNMEDESQWHHDCDGYRDGASEVLNYIEENFNISPK